MYVTLNVCQAKCMSHQKAELNDKMHGYNIFAINYYN